MNSVFEPIKRLFLNRQFTVMIIFIAVIAVLVVYTGNILAPFFAAVIIAYLLEGVIARLVRFRIMSRFWAVNVVFLVFLCFLTAILLLAVPEIGRQAKQAAANIPQFINAVQKLIMKLPETYPDLISTEQASSILGNIGKELSTSAQGFLSGGVIVPLVWTLTFVIYLILVPVMVYLMLKDKRTIFDYLGRYLPFDNPLLRSVWQDINRQIGNYIRGKFSEIMIIWCVTYIAFVLFELDYALLLSFMVGLSVLVPYIGATVVTVPVLIVAFVEWGFSPHFYFLAMTYFIIQIIDGNVLVPLIFSEAVSIHPLAIILAVLLFGGVWGFWGVFFAIPLATVINAIINAWHHELETVEQKK